MEENQKNDLGDLEKLAILSDSFADLFPNGKTLVVFELKQEDYKRMINNFRQIDHHHKQFTVEISGVDFHFMLEPEEKVETTEDKS